MTAPDALDPVAGTARLTAAARAAESERADRLFDDPLAATLAGEPGRALLAQIGELAVIPVRTHYFDARFEQIADGGVRQFVLLAAGMDTRAYRLPLPDGTALYELDRPELCRLKGSLLDDAPLPRCTRTPVGVDLAGDWTPGLLAAGFRPELPTCWLAEGLLQYLHEADVLALFDRLTALSAPGSHLLADFVGRSMLDAPGARPMLDLLAGWGAHWTYGTDEPEALFAERGWKAEVTGISAYGNALGRWPYPDAPGAPQGYLVHGSR